MKRLLLVHIALFLFTMVITSAHFPVGMEDQSNCAICKVAKDLTTSENTAPIIVAAPVATDFSFKVNIPKLNSTLSAIYIHNRAPPKSIG